MIRNAGGPRRLVVYGPLPPPHGGVTVSFQLLLNYLAEIPGVDVVHHNVPSRARDPKKVGRYATAWNVARSLPSIRGGDQILITGSKNFCLGYGSVIGIVARIFGKSSSMRVYGGRPYQSFASWPRSIQLVLTKLLSIHSHMSVETLTGRNDFPRALRDCISVDVGYRPPAPALNRSLTDESGRKKVAFVYTGWVARTKGVLLLLEAARELESRHQGDFEIHIYGNMEDGIDLGEASWLHYHGAIDNAELRKMLPEFDVFVFPTIYPNEGHSGALIEAMMAGLPVIASDIETISEVVDHEVNGLLFSAGDVSALALAMERLLNASIRNAVSINAIESAAVFDADSVLPRLLENLGIEV